MFLNFKPVVEVVRSVFVNVYQVSNWDQGGVKCAVDPTHYFSCPPALYSMPKLISKIGFESTKSIKIYPDARNVLLQIPDLRSKHLFPSSDLSVNNSGFYLPPIDMVLLDNLEKGKAQLRKEMKAFRK